MERFLDDVRDLPLDPLDAPTRELIKRLWRHVPFTEKPQLLYEGTLAEAVRLTETLHPEVTDNSESTRFWIEQSPYTNGIYEKLERETGKLSGVLETGWHDTQVTGLETERAKRETDLHTAIDLRVRHRIQPATSS